jgi:hypothetical protein
MRVRLKGINSITKTLANGSKRTYYYAWKGGPPIHGELGTPEFVHSYNEAIARKVVPPHGVLLSILQGYQASGEFLGRAERTRSDYVKHINAIEIAFGDFPLSALSDRRTRGIFMAWRDKLANSSRRQADYAWTVPGAGSRVGAQPWPDRRESLREGRAALSRLARRQDLDSGRRSALSATCARAICRCCSACGPGSGKAISCASLGPLMMEHTFGCGSRRPALASRY